MNDSQTATEAELDSVLANALSSDQQFAAWFLERTKFRGQLTRCVFCRSDNPWSTVTLEHPDAITGELKTLSKECETDILAVYETFDGRRLGLHIENKLVSGSFTNLQPELYAARIAQWQGRPKLGNYSEGTTVLVAPEVFFHRNQASSTIFESFVSHEDIGAFLPLFSAK